MRTKWDYKRTEIWYQKLESIFMMLMQLPSFLTLKNHICKQNWIWLIFIWNFLEENWKIRSLRWQKNLKTFWKYKKLNCSVRTIFFKLKNQTNWSTCTVDLSRRLTYSKLKRLSQKKLLELIHVQCVYLSIILNSMRYDFIEY